MYESVNECAQKLSPSRTLAWARGNLTPLLTLKYGKRAIFRLLLLIKPRVSSDTIDSISGKKERKGLCALTKEKHRHLTSTS